MLMTTRGQAIEKEKVSTTTLFLWAFVVTGNETFHSAKEIV